MGCNIPALSIEYAIHNKKSSAAAEKVVVWKKNHMTGDPNSQKYLKQRNLLLPETVGLNEIFSFLLQLHIILWNKKNTN